MSYNLWITSDDVLGPSLGERALDTIEKVAGRYLLQFPELPPAELFKLKLESFQLCESTGGLTNIAEYTITNGALTGALLRANVAGMSIRIRGFSTQASYELKDNARPEDKIYVGRVDLGLLNSPAGGTVGMGNAVNAPDNPETLVYRPRAGTYSVEFIGPKGGLVADNAGAGAETLGDWRMCLSLTPMTNNEIRDYDGKA
jgi:hypothetical protein